MIREAKKRLEERKAREEEARKEKEAQKAENKTTAPGKTGKKRGPKPKHPPGTPKPKDQENFTDPDSRIMKDGTGAFQQSYNAQIAVDEKNQIVVAAEVGQNAADVGTLLPTLDKAIDNTEQGPKILLADAGYRSEDNFQLLEEKAPGTTAAFTPWCRSDEMAARSRSVTISRPQNGWRNGSKAREAGRSTERENTSSKHRSGGSKECWASEHSAFEVSAR